MSATAVIASLIMACGALLLAWRGVRQLPRARAVRYAAIWAAIIVALFIGLRVAGA